MISAKRQSIITLIPLGSWKSLILLGFSRINFKLLFLNMLMLSEFTIFGSTLFDSCIVEGKNEHLENSSLFWIEEHFSEFRVIYYQQFHWIPLLYLYWRANIFKTCVKKSQFFQLLAKSVYHWKQKYSHLVPKMWDTLFHNHRILLCLYVLLQYTIQKRRVTTRYLEDLFLRKLALSKWIILHYIIIICSHLMSSIFSLHHS